MQPEKVKMIETPNAGRKVILKLKHIDVKFRVRGRILNAIRDVSLEIFDKETIAIVGESGSGKSVLTKTFAGMLDKNGYISHGNVYFSDDELSQTFVPLTYRNKKARAKVLKKINLYTKTASINEEYLALKELNEEYLMKSHLSAKEVERYDEKIKNAQDDVNDQMNLVNSLHKHTKEYKEEKRKLKEYKKFLEACQKEKEKAAKNKLKEIKNDHEYNYEFNKKKQALILKQDEKYIEAMKNGKISDELLERNQKIADELILSIGRFPIWKRYSYTRKLLARYQDFIYSGKDISTEKQNNRVYEPVIFRVKRVGTTTLEGNKDKVFFDNTLIPQFNLPEVNDPNARNVTLVSQAKGSYRGLFKSIYKNLVRIEANYKGRDINEKEIRRVKDFANLAIVYAADHDLAFIRKRFKRRFLKWFKRATESDGHDLDSGLKSKPIVTLEGYALIDCSKVKYTKDWQKIRGRKIATVFQDPMTSLNPILTIGKQIMIVIQKHQGCSKFEAKRRAIEIMRKVGIPDPEKRFDDYPFQYSGGMRQRIVIAIALSCQPKILICDEPTTALDVTIQAQIIRLIKSLSKDLGFTTVYITHDLGVVANVAERVAVLYGGQIVELGTVEEIFYEPLHPYTWALLSSLPQLAQRGEELFSISGTPPSLYNKIVGDAFAPRSAYALAIDFKLDPPMWKVSDTHFVKTWLLDPRAPKVEKPAIIQNLHEKMCKVYKDELSRR